MTFYGTQPTRAVDGHASPLDRKLLNAAGLDEVLDPIRIADRDRLVLVSDDLHFRQLADLGGVSAHAWLQAAALAIRADRRMSPDDYAMLVARLASRRHDFVTVDADTLIRLLGREGDKDDLAFALAARSIGGPKADLDSHANVVIGVACDVWSSPVASWRKGRAISRLLDNLTAGRGAFARVIMDSVQARLRITRGAIMGRPDLARAHVAAWRRGHFLDVVEPAPTRSQTDGTRKRRSRT